MGGGRYQGERERKNKMVIRHREGAEMAWNLVKTRSSWFLVLWVAGEGVSAKANVNSGDCNFSRWMLKSPITTSGVPS